MNMRAFSIYCTCGCANPLIVPYDDIEVIEAFRTKEQAQLAAISFIEGGHKTVKVVEIEVTVLSDEVQ